MVNNIFMMLFLLSACMTGCSDGINSTSLSKTASDESGSQSEGVIIHTQGKIDNKILLRLENKIGKTIFLSYQLLDEKEKKGIISNYLEKKLPEKDRFIAEPSPHSGPGINPVFAGEKITFEAYSVPEIKGEYRVVVRYFKDEKAYFLIESKIPFDWSDEEEQFISNSQKVSYSNSFFIPETK